MPDKPLDQDRISEILGSTMRPVRARFGGFGANRLAAQCAETKGEKTTAGLPPVDPIRRAADRIARLRRDLACGGWTDEIPDGWPDVAEFFAACKGYDGEFPVLSPSHEAFRGVVETILREELGGEH